MNHQLLSVSTTTLEDKEKAFREKIKILEQIEAEVTSLNKHYSEGQLSMGLASFQNEQLHHHLKPQAFAVGPASLTVNYDENNKSFQLQDLPKEKLRFIIDEQVEKEEKENKQQKPSFLVYNDEEDEQYMKEEQIRLEKQFKENGNDPISQFGIQYPPQQIFNAQSCMRKALDSALKIANLYSRLE